MSEFWEHIDLCSGIGGFSLGFQWAELSKPILFCELDEFCQKILKKHWPNVPICNDVKELANDTNAFIPRPRGRKRILTGGYPCQSFSQAGKRRGWEDPRAIWPYIFRIVQQERPNVCVFENVSGHISLGLDEVLHDLEGESYTTRTFVLPAEACGASHRRDRLWIIGRNVDDSNNDKCNEPGRAIPSEEERNKEQKWTQDSSTGNTSGASELRISHQGHDDVADTSGIRGQNVSRNDQENAKRPSEKENVKSGNFSTIGRGSEDVADTKSKGAWENDSGIRQRVSKTSGRETTDVSNANSIGRDEERYENGNTQKDSNQKTEGGEYQRGSSYVADSNRQRGRGGQTRGQDAEDARQSSGSEKHGGRNTKRRLGGMVDGLSPWLDEPLDIPRVATGQKNRTHRLKALGNAIIPQIAQRIGIAIKETL